MTHRYVKSEFIKNVVGAGSSGAIKEHLDMLVNPTNPGLFPWLSGLAWNYERYHFNALTFEYVTTSTDDIGGSNPAIGTVCFMFNGDATDASITNYLEFKNYKSTRCTKASRSMRYNCEGGSSNQNGQLYMREGLLLDIGDTYLGKIQCISQGQPTGAQIGEIWVHYDVTFITPKLADSIGLNLPTFAATYTCTTTSGTDDVWFGATSAGVPGTVVNTNNIGIVVTNNTITFPAGSAGAFLMIVNITGTGTAALAAAPNFAGTNISTINGLENNNNQPSAIFRNAGIAGTVVPSCTIIRTFKIDDYTSPAVLTLTGGTRPVSGSNTIFDLMIFPSYMYPLTI